MPKFRYKAIDRSGQNTHGEVTAPDEAGARVLLAERGVFVDHIARDANDTPIDTAIDTAAYHQHVKTHGIKLPGRLRVELVGQLATALQAQLPLVTALRVVGQQNPRPKVRELLDDLAESVTSGKSLSYAMSRHRYTFDSLHVSLVRAGEASGKLDESMAQLAAITERDFETRGNIMTASLYPAFVLCLGVISVAVVVTWILPRILETLATDVGVLPWPTRLVAATSTFLKLYGWVVVLGLMVIFSAFRQWRHTNSGRYIWDRITLTLPLVGPLTCKWAVSRFARTLGTLTASGINILESLRIVRDCLGNEALARGIDSVARKVRSGEGLSEPLRQCRHFPPLLIQAVAVGEETGKLATLLLRAADAFDKDTNVAIKRFMAIFPAVLILLLAVVVGFIVAATLLPIVQIETGLPGL